MSSKLKEAAQNFAMDSHELRNLEKFHPAADETYNDFIHGALWLWQEINKQAFLLDKQWTKDKEDIALFNGMRTLLEITEPLVKDEIYE